MTQLPTEFLRGWSSAAAWDEGQKLAIRLPLPLVPLRRYCDVSVRENKRAGYFTILIKHEEPFTGSQVGRNAWQTETDFSLDGNALSEGKRVRILERNWSAVKSITVRAKHNLEQFLRREPTAPNQMQVRVMPWGFELRLHRSPRGWQGLGSHFPHPLDVLETIKRHPWHGNGTSAADLKAFQKTWELAERECGRERVQQAMHRFMMTGYRTCVHGLDASQVYSATNALKYLIAREGGLPEHLQPNYDEEEEYQDMRKIDKPTPSDVPFGLFAGENLLTCQFEDGGKGYAYFAGGVTAEVGDYVVVASPYGDGCFDKESGGYLKVVRVTSTDVSADAAKNVTKWVIGKVDMTTYRERRKKLDELQAIDAQIERAKKDAMKELELAQLASIHPGLKALLDQRQNLVATGQGQSLVKGQEPPQVFFGAGFGSAGNGGIG